MRAEVLGPVRITHGGAEVAPPPGKVGALLRVFMLRPNETVAAADICASLWPGVGATSPTGRRRLQVTVSRLRAFLRSATPGSRPWTVELSESGYRLAVPSGGIDRFEFEELAAAALAGGDADLARRALALWGGEPYRDFPDSPELARQVARLSEMQRRLADVADPGTEEERFRRSKVRPSWPAGFLVDRPVAAATPQVGEVPVLGVIAPAGFGKSTFLAQWAVRQRRPVAWLSLDENDDDPAVFWAGIARALEEAGCGAMGLPDGTSVGSTAMLENLASVFGPGHELGLVLDDVHRITNARTLGDIGRLVASFPATCTIALASRDELPLPLSRRATDGTVLLVGSDDLRFRAEEMADLVEGDPVRGARLLELTEGWPFAAVALHRSGADLSGPSPAIVEQYVSDEVIDRLPDPVRRLVLEVAHLDAFTVDLCESVTERTDAGEALGWLRDRGLFVVDAGPSAGLGWYRFHPIIADVARRRGAATVNVTRVWRRAAAWCRTQGLRDTALEYAVRAGDHARLADFAGDVLLDSALRGEATSCVQLLRRIDPEHLVANPRGHGIGAYLATEWMDRDERVPWLRSRQRHFADQTDAVWLLITAIEAMREGHAGRAAALSEQVMHRCLDGTLDDVGELGSLLIGSSFSNLVRAKVLEGATGPDDPLFPSAVGLIRPHAPVLAAWVHSWWGLAAFVEGDVELATSLAEEFYLGLVSTMLGRPVRRDNSMLGALVSASGTTDAAMLQAIAEGLEDVPVLLETKGQHTEATVARLILAGIYRRAGLTDLAASHQRRADLAMRTFPDAPFLPRLHGRLASWSERTAAETDALDLLTPRQRTIAQYLATELSSEDIAAELYISRQTVRTHLRDIYRRLGVRSRHEAVARLMDRPRAQP